jgi:hypothetical protein
MEHNTEKIIREKVSAAEKSVLIWQKENVWLSIENNFEIKPHMSFKYYVAASASLALALFIFLLQPKNQIEQLKSDAITKANYKTEILPDLAKSITSSDECKESGSIISYALNNERIKSAHILNDTTIFQKTVVINTPKIETTELKELPLLLAKSVDTTVAEHVEQVHAIFGVEEKPVVTFSTKRQKKVHIKLFNTEEGTSPIQNTGEPVNLFARINKN